MAAPNSSRAPGPPEPRATRATTSSPALGGVPMSPGRTIYSEHCERYPPELRPIFGRRPLLPGEAPHEYDGLVRAIEENYRPNDFLGWFLVWQIAEATWDLVRLRKVACLTITIAEVEALACRLADLRPREGRRRTRVSDQDRSLARHILQTSPPEVEDELNRHGADIEHLRANAHLASLTVLEALDRLQSSAEKRIAVARRSAIELQFAREQASLYRERNRITPPLSTAAPTDLQGEGPDLGDTAGAVML